MTLRHKYRSGEKVWLAEFDNGDEIIPRQKALILCYENGMYTVRVTPEEEGDDGLRELSEDQIEGYVK